jgi:hypothetical protein
MAWVCDHSLAEIAGSIQWILYLVSVVLSGAVGQSLVQTSPTSVVCLKWGLHKATVYTTHQWVQSPTRETAVNKLAMPTTCRNEKTGQSANSTYFMVWHLRDELKNFSILSQGTYCLYQLHWASLQAGQYTSQWIVGKFEQSSTALIGI